MRQTPEERTVTERMAPGVLCREGLLGPDRRPLGEILDTDHSVLSALEVTPRQIADRLGMILAKAIAGLGTPVLIREGLQAVFHEAMGRIPSPWPGEGTFRKGHVVLTETATGRSVLFTPLSVHLIAEHGFFQGRGTTFRLDPDVLCEMLGLGADAAREA